MFQPTPQAKYIKPAVMTPAATKTPPSIVAARSFSDNSKVPSNPSGTPSSSGLEFDTLYYYRARAETPAGEVFFSEVFSFTTEPDPAPPDLVDVALPENGTSMTTGGNTGVKEIQLWAPLPTP